MFKIGDKLKRKESMWKGIEAYTLQPYEEFEVTAYFDDCKFPLVCFRESGSYQWDAAYFELIEDKQKTKSQTWSEAHKIFSQLVQEEKEELKVPKFKIGDKVISVKNTPSVPEGWIGYITDKISPDYEYVCHKVGYEDVTELFNEDELELLSVAKDPNWRNRDDITPQDIQGIVKPDVINSPKHYAVFESVEAIQVIASSMTQEQFYGYCLGNCLKYRLRAGAKDDVMQELAKANKYQELYTEHKHLCKEGK